MGGMQHRAMGIDTWPLNNWDYFLPFAPCTPFSLFQVCCSYVCQPAIDFKIPFDSFDLAIPGPDNLRHPSNSMHLRWYDTRTGFSSQHSLQGTRETLSSHRSIASYTIYTFKMCAMSYTSVMYICEQVCQCAPYACQLKYLNASAFACSASFYVYKRTTNAHRRSLSHQYTYI